MKKLFKCLLSFSVFIITSVIFISCSDDDCDCHSNNNTSTVETPKNNNLVGTSWTTTTNYFGNSATIYLEFISNNRVTATAKKGSKIYSSRTSNYTVKDNNITFHGLSADSHYVTVYFNSATYNVSLMTVKGRTSGGNSDSWSFIKQ